MATATATAAKPKAGTKPKAHAKGKPTPGPPGASPPTPRQLAAEILGLPELGPALDHTDRKALVEKLARRIARWEQQRIDA